MLKPFHVPSIGGSSMGFAEGITLAIVLQDAIPNFA